MASMFGFSRRRLKAGRLKFQLGDNTKVPRSPARAIRRAAHTTDENENGNESTVDATLSGRFSDSERVQGDGAGSGSSENWIAVPTYGVKPTPRFNHAAAVVGNKMVVVGGDSGRTSLGDTMILDLDKLTWTAAAAEVFISSTGLPLKIPACKDHCLVSWGKVVLLIGGKIEPVSERLSVWCFDVEAECWSHVEAKGDIPAARGGHSVIRAGPALILFGGEDFRGRKLNDLHMFDLKTSTWLPLHYTGAGPSPRSNHVATLYDDRILLVYGGQSKTKILNDVYSLDFETMVWSRIKIRGQNPSPRAGCCGALCGTKWYIVGGGSKKKRHAETFIFDVLKLEWAVHVTSAGSSIAICKGFSLVQVHQKDTSFLLAFGGNMKEPSNQVEILTLLKSEQSMSWRSVRDIDALSFENCSEGTKELGAQIGNGPQLCSFDSIARQSIASALEQSISGRKSLDSAIDLTSFPGNAFLRKQFDQEEHGSVRKMQKSMMDESCKDFDECLTQRNLLSRIIDQRNRQKETGVQVDIDGALSRIGDGPCVVELDSSDIQKLESSSFSCYRENLEANRKSTVLMNPSDPNNLCEAKIASLIRKNSSLEEQLTAALSSREAAGENLLSATRGKEEAERKLVERTKEIQMLRERLSSMELAHEEANDLSNVVHADNVRLEHDVAFLKAILDDTRKELHSTRGVLAAERTRAFQLQVEVFHLKQKWQAIESRAPTPRKPFS